MGGLLAGAAGGAGFVAVLVAVYLWWRRRHPRAKTAPTTTALTTDVLPSTGVKNTPLSAAKVTLASGTHGLKWFKVGKQKPKKGTALDNPGLVDALREKTEFTYAKWKSFGIENLRPNDFIKVDDDYFKPCDPGAALKWHRIGTQHMPGKGEEVTNSKLKTALQAHRSKLPNPKEFTVAEWTALYSEEMCSELLLVTHFVRVELKDEQGNVDSPKAKDFHYFHPAARPQEEDEVTIHYTAWVVEYNQGKRSRAFLPFYSSRKAKQPHQTPMPFVFEIGKNQAIKGLEEGIKRMLVGETHRLAIPSDLAYGERGAGSVVPSNAELEFEVELLGIRRAKEKGMTYGQPGPSKRKAPAPEPAPVLIQHVNQHV